MRVAAASRASMAMPSTVSLATTAASAMRRAAAAAEMESRPAAAMRATAAAQVPDRAVEAAAARRREMRRAHPCHPRRSEMRRCPMGEARAESGPGETTCSSMGKARRGGKTRPAHRHHARCPVMPAGETRRRPARHGRRGRAAMPGDRRAGAQGRATPGRATARLSRRARRTACSAAAGLRRSRP